MLRFKIFKQLQLHNREKLKINPIMKREWIGYYKKLWNEQYNNGKEGTEKELGNQMTHEDTDIIIMKELKYVSMHKREREKKEENPRLDNTPMELFKFGGNELKVNILKLFNNTVDRNNVPQEWETGIVINIHKQER